MTVTYELTDTFGGEANYSWCERGPVEVKENASDLAIVRAAKAAAGLSGVRCRKVDFGDLICLYPYGLCQVLFINLY